MASVYERALFEIDPNGKFQKQFDVFYNLVFASLWTIAYSNVILALVVIPHTCEIQQIPKNDSDPNWMARFIPTNQDSTGRSVYSSCLMYNKSDGMNGTKSCDSYTYNETWYGSTIPSANNWVCDDGIYVANVLAYSRMGEIIGSVILGWFGDIYGRRLTYILSLGLLIVGRMISVVASHSFTLFVIGCIMAWFPSWSVVQSATVISMEISSPERRSLTATYRAVAYSIGLCIMSFLYWWLRDWKPFMIVTTLTTLPFFFFSWKLIESPRWLLLEGKPEKCVKELRRIAKVNKTKLEEETIQEILSSTSKKEAALGPLSLFSERKLALNTILQLCLWVSVTLSYSVLIMSSGEKSDGNPFLEFAWQSIVEIPATFVGAWLADNIGRRYAGAISYFLSTLMWILMALSENVTWMQVWWLGSAIVTVNRLSNAVSYYVIYLLNMELYPTCLRQSGMSLGNVFSSGAGAIGPYLMHAGRQIDSRIPGACLSVIALFGLICSLLLPETLNTKLPETLADTQDFGKRNPNHISMELRSLHIQRQKVITKEDD